MNDSAELPWASTMQDSQLNPVDAMVDEEFADFLNLDSMAADFNYPMLDEPSPFQSFSTPPSELQATTPLEAGQSHPQAIRATPATASVFPSTGFTQGHDGPFQMVLDNQPGFNAGQKNVLVKNGFQQATSVPPTPNSIGMYPTQADYIQHMKHYASQMPQQQMGLNGHQQNIFTPGISPDLQGAQNYHPEMTVSGANTLSPLTSPAMTPQNMHGTPQTSHPHSFSSNGIQTAFKLNGASKPDVRMTSIEQEPPRKTRKKGPTTRSATSNARTRKAATAPSSKRQSSLNLKAQSKEYTGSLSSPPTATGERRMSLSWVSPDDGSSPQHTSSPSSVSPQPLVGRQMAPPPKPLTPATTPQVHAMRPANTQDPPNGLPPATPASMMRLQTVNRTTSSPADPGSVLDGDTTSPATSALECGMEVLRLPEAAAPPPEPLNGQHTPQAKAKMKQGRKSAASSNSQSTSESPRSSAVTSPQGPQGMNKSDSGKGVRATKKRNSNGSNLVSPALRPKISPSIKPILPEGANMDRQTQALLLASRSNYQNILEGSHLPGVSYPTDLSMNLTSKRTSHKIAEQGRRNRINMALQEMQGLLPSKFGAAAARDVPVEEVEAQDKRDKAAAGAAGAAGAAANGGVGLAGGVNGGTTPKTVATPTTPVQSGGNSKAATVESAIVYIRHLQESARERDKEIERLMKEMRELKGAGAVEEVKMNAKST